MIDQTQRPLRLAVVGHTNVGKTSLLRTLTRDVGFGEVSHRPSTTRHVEGARLSVEGEALLELYDTPGLEDAIALLDYLERLDRPANAWMARRAPSGFCRAARPASASNRKPRCCASC
jgi:predicted GTPase